MFDLQALGIEYGTLAMLLTLLALLITGMPLAFVTLLVAFIFALGWFGPSSIPLITKAADASAILDETALRFFNETCAASNLYEMLLCHKTGQPFIHEMKKPLRII